MESGGCSLVVVHGLLIALACLAAEHRLKGTEALVVVPHGFNCPVAYGVFLDQGSNLCFLHWQVDSEPLEHQDNPKMSFFEVYHT